MTIVAEAYRYVIGVDTHAATHTLAVLETRTGTVLDEATFPTTTAGLTRAISWIRRRTTTSAQVTAVLIAMEGTSSYGAVFAGRLSQTGYRVVEVDKPTRSARRGTGKTDNIDAVLAARSTLAQDVTRLASPRADGIRAALRVRLVARHQMDGDRTRAIGALTALARTTDLGVDARKALSQAQIRTIATWHERPTEDIATATARTEATRLAKHITTLQEELATNRTAITALVAQLAPGLQDIFGVGPISAAAVLLAWSHPGRLHSEAAFAKLAGTCPIPASSGKTTRHRLNRGGDRQLNRAIHTIVRARLNYDPTTRAYLTRRTAEGKTTREIRRCLTRYVTRELYRHLQRTNHTLAA